MQSLNLKCTSRCINHAKYERGCAVQLQAPEYGTNQLHRQYNRGFAVWSKHLNRMSDNVQCEQGRSSE